MEIEEEIAKRSAVEIEQCRALTVGISGFAECACGGPNSCAYALPFGYAFLCQHPRLEEIVKRTLSQATSARTNQ